MSKTDGSSMLLEFHGFAGSSGSFSAAPTGYTRQASAVGSFSGLCLNTKDVTTSDGSVNQATSANSGWRGSTVEILALAAATFLPKPVFVRQAVNRAGTY
jgi:predicted alpha/beta-fold hydrolase